MGATRAVTIPNKTKTPRRAFSEGSFTAFAWPKEAGEAFALDTGNICDGTGDKRRQDDQKKAPGRSREIQGCDARVHTLNKDGDDSGGSVEIHSPFGRDGNAVRQHTAVIADDGKNGQNDIGNVGDQGHIKALQGSKFEAVVVNADLFGVADLPGHGVKKDHVEQHRKDGSDKKQGVVLVGGHGEHEAKHSHADLVDQHFENGVGVFLQKVYHDKWESPFGKRGIDANVVGNGCSHTILYFPCEQNK